MNPIVVIWALGCLLFSQLPYAQDSTVEYKVKAAYIYNFTKFVTWVDDSSETFNLCILGDDPFGDLIDPIEQRSVMGRPIKLFRLDSLKSIKINPHCHILFVSSSIEGAPAAKDVDNTLVVGESKGFINGGGMVGFDNAQGKIKFQINLNAIKQSGLKVSAKLLEVAEVVKGGDHD